jgi:hypothetical protein
METEFMKYPKIYAVGKEENEGIFSNPDDVIVAEEKIDGANTRFMVLAGKIIFGSHNRPLDNPEDEKFFQRFIQHIKLKVKPDPSIEGFVFYGEMCVKHTINYDWTKIPPYLGFDVFDLKKGQFLDHIGARRMFLSIGLSFVPVLWVKMVKEIGEVSEKMIPPSQYWNGTCEGIVLKNYGKQLMAKVVAEQFKEKNKEVFGLSKKQARVAGDEELLVATYATNARIDKKVFELMSDGHELAMTMMQELPKRVIQDIYEENWREILNSNYALSMRQVRILITKRCLAVLKNIITNNELSKEATK